MDKAKILDNSTMQPGDVIIALPSTGVHSNGFSLVRKIFDIDGDPAVLKTAPAELGGKTLGEALLAPTQDLRQACAESAGRSGCQGHLSHHRRRLYENIPRSLKKGCCARIKKEDVRTPGPLPPDAEDRQHL